MTYRTKRVNRLRCTTLRNCARQRAAAVLVCLLALAGIQLVGLSVAYANPFGSGCGERWGCTLVNTRNVSYGWEGATGNQIPGIGAAFNWYITNMGTVLNPRRDDSLSFPHVIVTDVNGSQNGLVAWVNCKNYYWARGGTGNRRWCHGKKLKFNGWYDFVYDTKQARRHIVCHEVGHTVGLHHGPSTSSCMHSSTTGVTHLNQHHRNHINANY